MGGPLCGFDCETTEIFNSLALTIESDGLTFVGDEGVRVGVSFPLVLET